jgi:hypothetical protein
MSWLRRIQASNTMVIERVVDELFGEGPRALVARMICSGGEMNGQRINEIKEALAMAFPNKPDSRGVAAATLIYQVLSSLRTFSQDAKNVERLASGLGITSEEVVKACGQDK